MSNTEKIAQALLQIRAARSILREEKVLHHEKPVHCELAEWFVEQWLGGIRATNGSQKGWDVTLPDGKKIQVKSAAKADTNPSRWTKMSKHCDGVDEVIVVLFDVNLRIQNVYRIPITSALEMVDKSNEISWKKMEQGNLSVDLEEFRKRWPFLF